MPDWAMRPIGHDEIATMESIWTAEEDAGIEGGSQLFESGTESMESVGRDPISILCTERHNLWKLGKASVAS